MPPEPFQTARRHGKNWHLNRSKPFTGGHLLWLILDHIFLIFIWLLIFLDIFWLCFDNLSLFFWPLYYDYDVLDTGQTKPVKLKRQNEHSSRPTLFSHAPQNTESWI